MVQPAPPASRHCDAPADALQAGARALQDALGRAHHVRHYKASPPPSRDALYILFPLLIVLSTFLFLLLLFLVCVIILRRRRGIMLRDHDGPIDMSREDLVEGEGGFDTLESRWLESVSEIERRMYQRAKRESNRDGLPRGPPFICVQSSSCSIPRTPPQQISPFPNFCLFRKRASPPGRSSQTLKP